MGDYVRYYPLMDKWVGFKKTSVQVKHNERPDGKETSYSMRKRIELAINTSIAFSTKPLHIIIYFGFTEISSNFKLINLLKEYEKKKHYFQEKYTQDLFEFLHHLSMLF